MHSPLIPIDASPAMSPGAEPVVAPVIRLTGTCPRCHSAVARRIEQTEWLTLFGCPDCGWTFAKALRSGSLRD